MVRNKFSLVLLFLSLVMIPLVSAGSFNYNVVKLDKVYSGGEIVRGVINFNFTDYPAHTSFRNSWGESIALVDFIRANNVNYLSYNCSTKNCSIPYVLGNSVNSVSVNNGLGMAGLVLKGTDINSIRDAQIKISSGLAPSCTSPMFIVLGDANNVTISPTSYKDVACSTIQRGCFETVFANYIYPVIPYDGGHYCEKISLPPAPAYRIGAGIVQSTSGNSGIKMGLFSTDGDSLAECILPNVTQSSQNLDCIIKYSSSATKDYYVCIEAVGVSNYKIKAENNEVCGTSDIGSEIFPFDYDIYATPLQFDSPSITINDSVFFSLTGVEFSSWIQEYISTEYDNKCLNDCVVPISFVGQDQTVNFANVNIVYDSFGAQGLSSQNVYSIFKGDATINAKNLPLDISKAKFIVPAAGENDRLKIYLGESTVINSLINVSVGFGFSLAPTSVPYGVPVTYTINLANVTKTKWTFADGSGEIISNGPAVTHSYLKVGLQNVTVEATVGNSFSRKTFGVYVGDAKEGANATISLYEKRISSINANISTYPLWVQTAIASSTNMTDIASKLAQIKLAYSKAQNDSDYASVMTNLLSLNIPSKVTEVRKEEFPIAASLASIDVGLAESASGEQIESLEDFRSSLGYWTSKSLSGKITLKEIAATYDSEVKTLATVVKIEINPKDTLEPSFLLLSYSPGDILFSEDYNQKSVSGGTSIALQDVETYDFAITDKVTLEKLGAYVIPQVLRPLLESSNSFVCRVNGKCEEDLGENSDNCSDCRTSSNSKLIIYLILLFLLAGLAMVFIWTWYKKRFERTLFKNRGDFFNITTFIINSRRNGVKDQDIKKKLKKAGWTFDQIHYAFGKIK